MPCDISSGRATSCKDATGGIKGIYIHNYDEWYNNATTAINDLVNGLNAATSPNTYAYINTGTIGDDAIRVALIYKNATAKVYT